VAPGEAVVKIIVTRGAARPRLRARCAIAPTRVVAAFAPPNSPNRCARERRARAPLRARASEQPRLAGAKTLNRLENVLARGEWTMREVEEGCSATPPGA
jgi:4-amino-4-deoxychorismate lyase